MNPRVDGRHAGSTLACPRRSFLYVHPLGLLLLLLYVATRGKPCLRRVEGGWMLAPRAVCAAESLGASLPNIFGRVHCAKKNMNLLHYCTRTYSYSSKYESYSYSYSSTSAYSQVFTMIAQKKGMLNTSSLQTSARAQNDYVLRIILIHRLTVSAKNRPDDDDHGILLWYDHPGDATDFYP